MKRLKIHFKSVLKRLKLGVKLYFQETTIHGLRYITHENTSLGKSIFWSCIFLMSACLCVILIMSQIAVYQKNRVTTNIDNISFPVWKVRFPAVTICSYNVVSKRKFQRFKEILLKENIPEQEITNFFTNLSHLIVPNLITTSMANYSRIIDILERLNYDSNNLMRELSPGCNNMLISCYWKKIEKNCLDYFESYTTNMGYCCSFNNKNIGEKKTNIYVSGIGPTFSLSVHMRNLSDDDMALIKTDRGYAILIHDSSDYPDMLIYSSVAYTGYESSYLVTAQIIDSDEKVRSVPKQTRACAFHDEIEIGWTRMYSFSACIADCKLKALISLCKCVPFYFTAPYGVRYCNLLDLTCIQQTNANYENLHIMGEDMENNANNFSIVEKQAFGDLLSCDCYTNCNQILYTTRIDDRPRDSEEAVANVYFRQLSCMKVTRTIFITWEYILASIGGFIGLCLGGSILSVIECLYHFFNAVCSRYEKQNTIAPVQVKNYTPKLYISDFSNENLKKNSNFRKNHVF